MDHFNLSQEYTANQTANQQAQTFKNVTFASTSSSGQSITIQDLKTGDQFQGEIVAVGGEEVELKLANGQHFVAKLEGQVQLALGQILGFQVKSNQDAKIVLKPIYGDQAQMQVGIAALKMAGVPQNQKNMQMVTAMIEHGLPIDKNGIHKVYRQLLQNPQSNLDTIMQLNKLQLPVTPENMNQFESYQNMTYQLQQAAANVADDMVRIYDTLAMQPPVTTAQGELAMQDLMQQTLPTAVEQAVITMERFLTTITSTEPEQGKQNEGMEIDKPSATAVTQTENPTDFQDKGTTFRITGDEAQSETMIPVSVWKGNQQQSIPEGTVQVANSEIVQEQLTMQTKDTQVFRLSEQEMLPLRAETTVEELETLMQKEQISLQQLTQFLTAKQSIFSLQQKEELFQSDGFRQYLQKQIQKEWSLLPEEVGKPHKVVDFYQRLAKQVTQLSDIQNEVLKDTAQQPKSFQNLNQNLTFMNQMNQVFQYVQLPLKFSEQQAHGDLYVYTNKKHLAQKEGTLTAFLHLDLDHIGSLNVHIALETQKNKVTTKFEVEKQMLAFVSSCLGNLDQKLTMLGYQVKSSLSAIKEKETVVKQLQERTGVVKNTLSYQAFDIRA